MLHNDIIKGRYSTYQLQDVIGKGGNAVVYSAVDSITQKLVAIKRMIAADESTLHRWRIEVEALISLREQGGNSQFVVAYLDHMQAGKAIMLVEEYAPNGSLLSLLRRHENNRRGLDEGRVMAYMYQITRGLAYIHSKRIVHRDLKCANVLLFDEGRLLKLSDFGLAAGGPTPHTLTAADAEVERGLSGGKGEEEGGVLGSIYWMAPEIACGRPHSTSSDVWSLGCLCVELLTGRPPFFDREPVNALYCIAEGNVSPMPQGLSLSDDCRSFLHACFNTDPARRASAGKLVQHRWFSELRIDRRLAELAALSRSVGSREPSAVNESGHGAVSPGFLSPGGSTREPWSLSASFAQGRSGANSPSAMMVSGTAGASRTQAFDEDGSADTDDLGQVVEHTLFSRPAAQCEQWLSGHGLVHVVDNLDQVIPGEAYNVLRIIAFAAKSREAKHRHVPNCLGETDLWQRAKLLQPTTRSDLVLIFSCCCERQSPDVAHYTPADRDALHFLLSIDDPNSVDDVNRTADATAVEAAHNAAQALHNLFVPPPSPTTTSAADTTRAATEELSAAHRLQAMRLFVLGGGFEEVRRVLELQCERSLRTTAEPPLGWPVVSRLMEVLAAVEALVSPLSAGPSAVPAAAASASGAAAKTHVDVSDNTMGHNGTNSVFVAATACRLMWGPHIAVALYGARALDPSASAANSLNAAGAGATLCTTNSSSFGGGGGGGPGSPISALGGAGGSVTGGAPSQPLTPHTALLLSSAGVSPGEGTAPSSPHVVAPVGAMPASAVDGSGGGPGTRSDSAMPAKRSSFTDLSSQQAIADTVIGRAGTSPTVRWFLGIQHASRSHHCPPAIPLLLRYAELSVLTNAPNLESIGRWLGRSVLLLASYQDESPAVRLHALEVLAGLAQMSGATRAALRDADVVVPVLTFLTRHPPLADGGQQMVLRFVQAVCLIDAGFALVALAAGSHLVAALVTVLHSALELAGLGPGEPMLDGADAEARAERLATEAAARGRHPLEEVASCLALLSQAFALATNTNTTGSSSASAGTVGNATNSAGGFGGGTANTAVNVKSGAAGGGGSGGGVASLTTGSGAAGSGGAGGGGGAQENSHVANLAEPVALNVLANDLAAMHQRLPADNGMADVLRGQAQSLLTKLVAELDLRI